MNIVEILVFTWAILGLAVFSFIIAACALRCPKCGRWHADPMTEHFCKGRP